MTRRSTLTLALALLGTAVRAASSGPEDRTPTDPRSVFSGAGPVIQPPAMEEFFSTHSVAGAAWSPDGERIAFTSDASGRHNLWLIPAAGGAPVQLTHSEERQFGAAWSPDGQRLAFQQDQGGNELWDVWVTAPDGSQPVNLTATPAVSESAPRWSPDGRRIAVEIRRQEAAAVDLAVIDIAMHRVRDLTHERSPTHSWSSAAWSPDGRTIYATRQHADLGDADVYAIDVATGHRTNLTRHRGRMRNLLAAVSPDGRTLLLSSAPAGSPLNVALLDLRTGRRRWVTHTRWEAVAGNFAPDGRSLTYALNAEGMADTFLADVATLQTRRIPLPAGVSGFDSTPTAFAPSGDRLLLTHESSVQPGELWVYELQSGALRQLTQSATAALAAAVLPPAQRVRYRSFDGTLISALLWMPANLQRDGSHPAVVEVHGGPADQAWDEWNPWIAMLVARGFVCIAPDVRGSSGFGSAFLRANYQDLGGADLQDEVYAARFLRQTGYVDPGRVGIMGGSYGGFMALMAIGRTPQEWAAAVDYVGVVNWLTMMEHADPHLRQYIRSLLGDPVRDRRAYEAASPINYLHAARAPLLILQGENDPRVPREESAQVVAVLQAAGRTVEVHYYPDEGHGFVKREDRIDTARRTVEWFERYLKGTR